MRLSIATDDFGRMICSVSDGRSEAVVTAAELSEAAAGLAAAVDDVLATGLGECYWPEGIGEYRWVFRRTEDQLKVAVLWSTGTMTGWEHVFWSECDCAVFVNAVRAEIARSGAVANA